MTLIIAYHYHPNTTLFVHDFRTTHSTGSVADNAIKFHPIGENLIMFLAGNVNAWESIITENNEKILMASRNSNFPNFINEIDTILKDYAFKFHRTILPGTKCSAYVVKRYVTEEEHKTFSVEYIHGVGVIISPLNNRELKIIGSGADIPNLSVSLYISINNFVSRGGIYMDALHASSFLKHELNTFLHNLNDSGIYKRMGISSIFAVSYIKNNHFAFPSFQELQFDPTNKILTKVNFSKDSHDQISFYQPFKQTSLKVHWLNDIPSNQDARLDPFKREE